MMGPGEEESEGTGSPYLYDESGDDELGHRPNDVANPGQWDEYRGNPNQDLVDMPESIEDPTDLEWMD